MEHFVTLARRIKRPRLLRDLIERSADAALSEVAAVVDSAEGPLAMDARKALFHAVASLGAGVCRHIERAAERVVLLTDECGAQAVRALLDEQDCSDATILTAPSDRYSQALYLFLQQEFPQAGAKREQRLNNAERLQLIYRQWKSEDCSCHYLGPMGVVPKIDTAGQDMLCQRIAALYPRVSADQILIDQFARRDLSHADRCAGVNAGDAAPVLLHTLTATFNGSTACFRQVANGELIEFEEPAAVSISFSWEPGAGALAVFCENCDLHHELAHTYGYIALACDGQVLDMPMRQFDLSGFSTPTMLKRIEQECVAGIEKVSILQIKINRTFKQQGADEANGRDLTRPLTSTMLIDKDRNDARQFHQVVSDDYGIDDLTGYKLAQVNLLARIAAQPHRQAHNVAIQITAPNGINDKAGTGDDRKRVLEQLARIGVLRQR